MADTNRFVHSSQVFTPLPANIIEPPTPVRTEMSHALLSLNNIQHRFNLLESETALALTVMTSASSSSNTNGSSSSENGNKTVVPPSSPKQINSLIEKNIPQPVTLPDEKKYKPIEWIDNMFGTHTWYSKILYIMYEHLGEKYDNGTWAKMVGYGGFSGRINEMEGRLRYAPYKVIKYHRKDLPFLYALQPSSNVQKERLTVDSITDGELDSGSDDDIEDNTTNKDPSIVDSEDFELSLPAQKCWDTVKHLYVKGSSPRKVLYTLVYYFNQRLSAMDIFDDNGVGTHHISGIVKYMSNKLVGTGYAVYQDSSTQNRFEYWINYAAKPAPPKEVKTSTGPRIASDNEFPIQQSDRKIWNALQGSNLNPLQHKILRIIVHFGGAHVSIDRLKAFTGLDRNSVENNVAAVNKNIRPKGYYIGEKTAEERRYLYYHLRPYTNRSAALITTPVAKKEDDNEFHFKSELQEAVWDEVKDCFLPHKDEYKLLQYMVAHYSIKTKHSNVYRVTGLPTLYIHELVITVNNKLLPLGYQVFSSHSAVDTYYWMAKINSYDTSSSSSSGAANSSMGPPPAKKAKVTATKDEVVDSWQDTLIADQLYSEFPFLRENKQFAAEFDKQNLKGIDLIKFKDESLETISVLIGLDEVKDISKAKKEVILKRILSRIEKWSSS